METKVCIKCGNEFVGGLMGQEICDSCKDELGHNFYEGLSECFEQLEASE